MYRVYIDRDVTLNLGPIKGGPHRYCVAIPSGYISGPGIEATILPGGSDWLLLDVASGVAHLDIRTHARTATGVAIYIHYTGVLRMDAATQKCLAWEEDARSTQAGDHHWWIGPQFEVGAEELKWLEQTAFVGQGHWIVEGEGKERKTAVEYEVYKVVG